MEIKGNQCRVILKEKYEFISSLDIDTYVDISYYKNHQYEETRVTKNNQFETLNKGLVRKLKKQS